MLRQITNQLIMQKVFITLEFNSNEVLIGQLGFQ